MRPIEFSPSIEDEPKQELNLEAVPQEEEMVIIEEANDFADLYKILRKQKEYDGQDAQTIIDNIKGFVKVMRALGSTDNIDPAFLEPIPSGLHEKTISLLKNLIEAEK